MLIDLLFAGGLAASVALHRPDDTTIAAVAPVPSDYTACDQGFHSGLDGSLQIDEGTGTAVPGNADRGAARPAPVSGCTLV